MNLHIAYQGKRFTIEWYFDTRGRSDVREYFNNLSPADKEKLLYLFALMGNFGTIRDEQKFRHEEDQIYALKPRTHRFLSFFFIGSKIIITNAFEKKCPKLSPREKEKALRLRQNYEKRVKAGTYYE